MRYFYSFLATIVFGIGTVSGQQVFTLQQCVEQAIEKNTQLVAARLLLNERKAITKQSKLELLPNLNTQANQNFSIGRAIDPFTNDVVEGQTIRSNSFSLSSSVVLFGGKQITNTINLNQLTAEQQKYAIADLEFTTTLNVLDGYLNILMFKELVRVRQLQLKNTEVELAGLLKFVDAGTMPESELAETRARVSQAKADLVNAKNQLQQSLLRLGLLMQLNNPLNFDVAQINAPTDTTLPTTDPKQIWEKAKETIPAYQQNKLQFKAAQVREQIARGGYLPRLSLSGSMFTNYSSLATTSNLANVQSRVIDIGYLENDPSQRVLTETIIRNFDKRKLSFTEQLEKNLRQSFSLSLFVPIFSNGTNNLNVQRAKIAQLNVENQRTIIDNTYRNQTYTAYLALINALEAYKANQNLVTARQTSYQVAQKSAKAGTGSVYDISLAQIQLSQSETQLIRSKFVYLQQKMAIDFYLTGTLK